MKSITTKNLNIFFFIIRFIYRSMEKIIGARHLFMVTANQAVLDLISSARTSTTTKSTRTVSASSIATHLGDMLIIADDSCMYMIEFFDNKTVHRKIARIAKQMHVHIVVGRTAIMDLIEKQISLYFQGIPFSNDIPMCPIGSPFQKSVWKLLQEIPFGQTCSYAQLAERLGNPKAFRAVANANGSNPFCILIPCHRVISSSGSLGGYGGGIERKQLLLDHEKSKLCKNGNCLKTITTKKRKR